MGWLENVLIEDKEIANERLELTDKNSPYFLGPNLSLRNYTVILKVSARNLIIVGARFIDCTFEVKQELKNHQQWVKASLNGCRFKGRLTGCDFGHWPNYGTGWEHGGIKDCDFTEARLDGCRIMGADPATIRFPKWPCFTILDPIGRASELRSVKWPGRFGSVVVDELHTQPACTKALTEHSLTIAKQLDTTQGELRAVIENFDCIIY
ncbi:pentapeptide repeat-containing protein [Hyalangium versicolor]|uniref:pentapeptide repeat-containing protein n=1 Tax=Hyalangium versicolor TaxID=2861190 RepID=UPI001CCEE8B5|nr:pentapeptide repeat-containing protein [Hyalangium versicolor]